MELIIEIFKALGLLIFGCLSITCLYIGYKVWRCPSGIYEKYRSLSKSQGGKLSKEQMDDVTREIFHNHD